MKKYQLILLVFSLSLLATAESFSPEQNQQMSKLYDHAARTYMGYGKDEFSFTIDASGNPREITSSHDFMHNSSPGDVNTAKHVGIPNYVLSQSELWVAEPDGSVHKVGK